MPISKIRKYLDDLKIQADAAKRRDIDIAGAPKTLEPVLLTELEWKDKRTGRRTIFGWDKRLKGLTIRLLNARSA
jgi:hypothetical protein